ncbi:unnamed protein product [Victoria cruziana]
MASRTKQVALLFIFQQLLAVACGQDNSLKTTIPIGNMGAASGGSPPADNPLSNWVNEQVMNYQNSQMKAVAAGGSLDPKLQAAEKNPKVIAVAADGSGDFKTITEAVASVPAGNTDRTIIKIKSGTYNEKVQIENNKPFITFLGSAGSKPTIVFGGTAAKYGTFYSATVCVLSDYFMASNVIFKNSAPNPPPGSLGGQAVALRIAGDKAAFYNCEFVGFQDTLHDDVGHHYFESCVIQGSVDFIFGDGRSYYKSCAITSVAEAAGVSAITAQGRDSSSDDGGFAFVNCKITGSGKSVLGRAWRSYSRVIFANCFLGDVVDPSGWSNRGLDEKNLYYAEYKCTGPGATSSGRVSYSMVLTDAQAQPFLTPTFVDAGTWLLKPPSA